MKYGIKEYIELLDRNIEMLKNPYEVAFGVDPHSGMSHAIRTAKMESLNYAIEMIPCIPTMKDDEFRDCVNELRDLSIKYAHTDQLRSQLSSFLRKFHDRLSIDESI